MRRFFSTAIAASAVAVCFGQTPTPSPAPAFDAASIKPSEMTARGGDRPFATNIQTSPVSLTIRNTNFRASVAWAYHVMPVQVNGPDWMDSSRFDIAAHAESKTDVPTLRVMLQNLLAARFHFQAHVETKEMSCYVLSQAKGGVKVHESADDGESAIVPDRKTMTVTVSHTPVSQLTELLSMFFRAPILDETGLTGKYDIKLDIQKYVNEKGGIDTDPQTLIVQVLQEDLGLKLEPKKAPIQVVIVDKSDKTPTEN